MATTYGIVCDVAGVTEIRVLLDADKADTVDRDEFQRQALATLDQAIKAAHNPDAHTGYSQALFKNAGCE